MCCYPDPPKSFWDKLDSKENWRFLAILLSAALWIMLMLSATSCVTQKQVDKICQTCPKETVEKTVYKDSVVEKWYKTDPLLDSLLFVSSWNPEKQTDTVYIEDTHWKGLFYVSTGKLTAQINYLSDSLLMLKQSTTTSVNASEIKTVEKKVLVDKPIRDKWYKFYCKFTWIAIIFILVVIVLWSLWKYGQLQIKWLAFMNRF